MNKTELIDIVAKRVNLKKSQAGEVIDAIQEAIQEALKEGQTISLIGFGTFSVATRAARTGRNPRTGIEINIPEARVPKFRPGKALRDAVEAGKPSPVVAVASAAKVAPAAPAAKAATAAPAAAPAAKAAKAAPKAASPKK